MALCRRCPVRSTRTRCSSDAPYVGCMHLPVISQPHLLGVHRWARLAEKPGSSCFRLAGRWGQLWGWEAMLQLLQVCLRAEHPHHHGRNCFGVVLILAGVSPGMVGQSLCGEGGRTLFWPRLTAECNRAGAALERGVPAGTGMWVGWIHKWMAGQGKWC